MTNKVAQKFEEIGLNKSIIAPSFTNLFQPADVCWFKPIKSSLHAKWTHWFLYEEKTYTTHNNMRSPGYAKVIQWLSEIWRDFDTHTIANSFDFCGINSQSSLHSVLNEIYSNKNRRAHIIMRSVRFLYVQKPVYPFRM